MYNVSLSVFDLEDIWDDIIEKVSEYTYDLELSPAFKSGFSGYLNQ